MIDINELRDRAATFGSDYLTDEEWIEVIDRLEAAEKERDLTMRLADSLALALNTSNHERDTLRAKIEAMEKQEPHSYIYEYSNPLDGSPVWRNVAGFWNAQYPKSSKPLYTLPGAQPAPSVPDVDALAQFIRSIDGKNDLGAGALAERIVEWLSAQGVLK